MYILVNSNKQNEFLWEKFFVEFLIFYFYKIYVWFLIFNFSYLVMYFKGVRDIK